MRDGMTQEKKGLRIVVEYEKSHFDLQWRRKEILDSKASNLISIIGIILGVYTASSSFLLEKMAISPYFYVVSALFILGTIFYLYAAYNGLKALAVRKYSLGPDPQDFADKWADAKEEDTLIALMLALVDSSKKVSAVSNEQARNLESGHRYLVFGLFWTFLFVLSLIFAKILDALQYLD
jgi:hypothetical protein